MSRPGGLQLSPVQIVASLLATLTGAILASYLGVGGTLTGAAVGSIASTTGTEIYRHYLRRSQERLKAAGEVLRHREATGGQHARHAAGQQTGTARLGDAATETLAASHAARGTVAGRSNGRGPDRSPDATETQIIPAAPEASAWQRRAAAAGPGGPGGAAGHTAGEHATGELSAGAAADGGSERSDGSSGPWWRNISRRQWLIYGGVTLSVFLVGMVVITIIELSAGKPLDAAVWGKHSTGTSVGNLVGGSGGHKQQPATSHTSTPTTQPSGTVPNSSPAATPSGTAPTPSTSPSSVPSSGSATPTPGGGQASGQQISPTP
jgi:hypothetical protein